MKSSFSNDFLKVHVELLSFLLVVFFSPETELGLISTFLKKCIIVSFNCQFLLPDLPSPEAPVCWGAPAGSVPGPASHVCVPAVSAAHSEFGGTDPALWRNGLQNCASGRYLHREVQRQETRGKQDPVWAVGAW